MPIDLLPADVIDQIAAGEVIERPASVVKELVDNALDAGAKTITIECVGRELVRVIDDGVGMSPEDLPRAVQRHATSKLRAIEDLWTLATVGFRGEALAAIASVSTLTITTRRAADLAGTKIVVDGGVVESFGEVGAPVGTTVEVARLFHTVPARQKFLKAEGTEASHVTEVIQRLAMAHPELHVKLRHNGRLALELPPDRDGISRARALLGTRIAQRLIETTGTEEGIRITAFLGGPELAQTTARGVQIFVGRRPVKDRGLLHAIAMGYGELVPRGRYPIAIVLLDLPGETVDYNVHPQKAEVRFSDAGKVYAAVRHVIQTGVQAAAWRDEGAGHVVMTGIASAVPPTALAMRYAAQLADQRKVGGSSASSSQARLWVSDVHDQVRTQTFARGSTPGNVRASDIIAAEVLRAPAVEPPPIADDAVPAQAEVPEAFPDGSAAAATPGYFSQLRYIGQVDLTYLACETDGELVLVDQHAAHERVELARLKQRAGDRELSIQRMLFPVTLDVTAEQLALVGRVGDALAHVGFEAEAFGKSTIAVKAVPAGIRHGDPTQLLRKLLTEWVAQGTPSAEDIVDRMLAEIACHSVVRAGDRLGPAEAEALLKGLDAVDHGGRGPHGRPLLLRLPLAEIARRFGR